MSLTDNEPCPACGGDRLRPDRTGSGRCHAGTPPRAEDVLPGLAALDAFQADFTQFAAMAARHAAELEERRAEVEERRAEVEQFRAEVEQFRVLVIDLDELLGVAQRTVARRGRMIADMRAKHAELSALLAEVIPYAIAGAHALDFREPYGDAWHDRAAHAALCDGADTMLARLRTGGDIATAAGAR